MDLSSIESSLPRVAKIKLHMLILLCSKLFKLQYNYFSWTNDPDQLSIFCARQWEEQSSEWAEHDKASSTLTFSIVLSIRGCKQRASHSAQIPWTYILQQKKPSYPSEGTWKPVIWKINNQLSKRTSCSRASNEKKKWNNADKKLAWRWEIHKYFRR